MSADTSRLHRRHHVALETDFKQPGDFVAPKHKGKDKDKDKDSSSKSSSTSTSDFVPP